MDLNIVLAELAAIATVLYTVYGVIYRLYLSPIAHFPGRKLAALTFWYEFYFDVIKRGSYVWEIQEMHKVYGTLQDITHKSFYIVDTICRSDHPH